MASPLILYRGGELDSVNLIGGSLVADTATARHDTAYSVMGISLSSNTVGGIFRNTDMTQATVDGGDELWVSYYLGVAASSTGAGITIIDESGRAAFRVNHATATATIQHNTSATGTPSWTNLTSFSGTSASYWAFRVKTGGAKTFSFYCDGNMVGEGAFTNASIGPLSNFTCGSFNGTSAISQIHISRNIPLVGSRVLTRKATGAGSFSAMSGVFGNLVKTSLNDSTAISSTLVGQTSTFTYQTVAVPDGFVMDGGVWVWSRGKNDGLSPSSMKIVSIADSVTTKSPDLPFDVGFKQMPAVFTGYTPAKWNGGQIGMESTAP